MKPSAQPNQNNGQWEHKSVSKLFLPFAHQEQHDSMKGKKLQTRVNLMKPQSYEMLRDCA